MGVAIRWQSPQRVMDRLVAGCTLGADAGLATHVLRLKGFAFPLALLTIVHDRAEPDAHEGDDHREQRRVLEREDGVAKLEDVSPDGRAENDEQGRS